MLGAIACVNDPAPAAHPDGMQLQSLEKGALFCTDRKAASDAVDKCSHRLRSVRACNL
jgi:hypothetical protein